MPSRSPSRLRFDLGEGRRRLAAPAGHKRSIANVCFAAVPCGQSVAPATLWAQS